MILEILSIEPTKCPNDKGEKQVVVRFAWIENGTAVETFARTLPAAPWAEPDKVKDAMVELFGKEALEKKNPKPEPVPIVADEIVGLQAIQTDEAVPVVVEKKPPPPPKPEPIPDPEPEPVPVEEVIVEGSEVKVK